MPGDPRSLSSSAVPSGSRSSHLDLSERQLASEFLSAELDKLVDFDSAAAFSFLAKFEGSELRGEAIAEFAYRWSQLDPIATADWLKGLDKNDRPDAVVGLVSGWVEIAPEAALKWCMALNESGGIKQMAVHQCALAWAETDGRSAIEAFWRLKSEPVIEDALQIVATTWPMDDPDGVLAYFDSLPASERREEYLEAALVSMTNIDPDRVWREASRAKDEERQNHIRSQALEAIAEKRPEEAIRIAKMQSNPVLFLRAVGRGWSIIDPTAAQRWAEDLSDESIRESILGEIVTPTAPFEDPREAHTE